MKLGLGSYSFRWSIGFKGIVPAEPMQPTDLLEVAARQGLDLVQFADNIPLANLTPEQQDELKSNADQLNLSIELGTQSFDAEEVQQYLKIAHRLGAKILRVALDGPDAQKPVPILAAEFRALLPEAEVAGVRIAIENHFNFPSARLLELLETIDNPLVGACLDVANSICAGEWPMETVAILAPRAINLHLKDYVIVPDEYGVGFAIYGCPLGEGRADCKSVLAALPDLSNMSVILEHWLPREDDMKRACQKEHLWLSKHVRYARDTLGL